MHNTKQKSLSIRMLITLPSIAILVAVTILIAAVVHQVSSKIYTDQISSTTLTSIHLVAEKLDLIRADLKYFSSILISDTQLQAIAMSNDSPTLQQSLINRRLGTIIEPRSFIDNAFIYTTNSRILLADNTRILTPISNEHIDEIDKELTSNNRGAFHSASSDYYLRDNAPRYAISFLFPMYSMYSGHRIATVNLSVLETYFSSLYSTVSFGKTGTIFFTDEDGLIISHIDKEQLSTSIHQTPYFKWVQELSGDDSHFFDFDGEQHLVMAYHYPAYKWNIIGTVPMKELTLAGRTLTGAIITSSLLALLFALPIVMLASNYVSKPVLALHKRVARANPGQPVTLLPLYGCREIEVLSEEFTQMMMKTHQLMLQIKEAERTENENTLKALQAQMNPHFLYNSLETISGLVDLNRCQQAIDMLQYLSLFYRGVLSKGLTTISLQKDLDIVENYLNIMNVRYGHTIECEMDIDERTLSCDIVKLTLQPLVENAIIHGFDNVSGICKISIATTYHDEFYIIKVRDYGAGISEEQAQHVLTDGSTLGNGFGLKSTNERLKLHFGAQYGLFVQNVPPKGVCITITLPTQEEAKHA